MTTTDIISLTTGATAAAGSVLLNEAPSPMPLTSIIVPAVSAIIGSIVSFVVLKTTVSRMEHDVRDMRRDMGEMYTLLREALTKIAHMEGRLDHRP